MDLSAMAKGFQAFGLERALLRLPYLHMLSKVNTGHDSSQNSVVHHLNYGWFTAYVQNNLSSKPFAPSAVFRSLGPKALPYCLHTTELNSIQDLKASIYKRWCRMEQVQLPDCFMVLYAFSCTELTFRSRKTIYSDVAYRGPRTNMRTYSPQQAWGCDMSDGLLIPPSWESC